MLNKIINFGPENLRLLFLKEESSRELRIFNFETMKLVLSYEKLFSEESKKVRFVHSGKMVRILDMDNSGNFFLYTIDLNSINTLKH